MDINYRSTHIPVILLLLIIFSGLVSGCTFADRRRGVSVTPEVRETLAEGKGDAYSYKVRIFRDGKKNTIHFDAYYNGDSLSLFAKGYLGKGVLKGLIANDSISVYFPTGNEYYFGKIDPLIGNSCLGELKFERLILDLFSKTPDELDYSTESFYLKIDKDEHNEKKFRFISSKCGEELYLEYDVRKNRFIPDKIEFSKSDGSFKLIAERKRYRLGVSIPAEKFEIPIPSDAIRIFP